MVRWEDFSKRRKIKLSDLNYLTYQQYCEYCRVRGVIPVTEGLFVLKEGISKPTINAIIDASLQNVQNKVVEKVEQLEDPKSVNEIVVDEFIVEKPLSETILPDEPDWSKIDKMRKTDIQSLCYDCKIDYDEVDTKKMLISKLKKEYGVK